jgi:polar amino acid transport system ATP-binding protein
VIFIEGGVVVEQGEPVQVLTQPRQERTREFLSSVL